MSESDFERDTAVRRDGDSWAADLQPRWNVGDKPNGGYLLAIAVRALREAAGKPDPVTVTAHYLSPPGPGGITIDAQIVKPGRTFVTATAEMVQGGGSGCACWGLRGSEPVPGPDPGERPPAGHPSPGRV